MGVETHMMTGKSKGEVSTKCGAVVEKADQRRHEWTSSNAMVSCPECLIAIGAPSSLTGSVSPTRANEELQRVTGQRGAS